MTYDPGNPGITVVWTDAMKKAGSSISQLGHNLVAEGAFAWLNRGGDITAARSVLDILPLEVLRRVSATGMILASLADEAAGAKRP